MREERRFRRVAGHEPELAPVNAAQYGTQTLEVHRLFEAIADRLRNQWMIGDLPIARDILQARGRIGEDRRHQVVRQHPLDRRRHFARAARARHGQRDRRVPPPPRLEHRRVEKRLNQHVFCRLGVQVAEHVRQRERVLRPEREHQRVFGGGRLQLEVELPAEALAQGEAPGLVDAAAERRMQHELHAAGLVEESLEHQRVLRRNHTERAPALCEVRHGLVSGVAVEAGLRHDPIGRRSAGAGPARGGDRARPAGR